MRKSIHGFPLLYILYGYGALLGRTAGALLSTTVHAHSLAHKKWKCMALDFCVLLLVAFIIREVHSCC